MKSSTEIVNTGMILYFELVKLCPGKLDIILVLRISELEIPSAQKVEYQVVGSGQLSKCMAIRKHHLWAESAIPWPWLSFGLFKVVLAWCCYAKVCIFLPLDG